jgi:hypothetical protein
MAHMGRPFATYMSLGVRLSYPVDSGSLLVSPGGDPVVVPFQVLLGKAESHLHVVTPCFLRPACGSGGSYLGHVLSN